MMAAKNKNYGEDDIVATAKAGLSDEQLAAAMDALSSLLEKYRESTSATVNAIAKQREFVNFVTGSLAISVADADPER